ncbi:hypothetical protein PFLUV_G00001090 [Perca fluviatilis]|uniref:Endonuclease/exonuclease/phosphatase domain-containing protein n=1 Tax=Perca fluviatilis TaxID=8168 RepID=A0A6A5FRE0_PERFL|nr:hypothetical protein PFLUV_G00001090 [Perca fluviatilis]
MVRRTWRERSGCSWPLYVFLFLCSYVLLGAPTTGMATPVQCSQYRDSYKGTCASGCSFNVAPFPLPLFFPSDSIDLVCLSSTMFLCDNFTTISCVLQDSNFGQRSNEPYKKSLKHKFFIVLLLLMSGNVQPNPGPDTPISFNTPADFKERSGLGFFHLNVRSLVPKMDMLRIWAHSTDADVFVLSETWLSNSVSDKVINISGYNVFRSDRPNRGGGVAIYIKNQYQVNVLLSKSIVKQFEFLSLDLEVSKSLNITVVGCYRTPSAVSSALPSLMQLLSDFNSKELVAFGDLNWNWLQPASDDFRAYCDSLNLFQIVDSPTRPNFKNPEKSSLIDVILTNAPHKYSTASIFANDISDHCVVATVRNTKIPKTKPRIIVKRNMKHFSEQEFLNDLSNYDWEKINTSTDIESAWSLFYEGFTNIINKYAPLKKYRVKGRDSVWFSSDLAITLHERNVAWAKARSGL